MAKRVLITGFEPFGEERVNPSELVVRSLEGRVIAGSPVSTRILPVETRSLHDRLETLFLEEQPDIVLGTGLAGGRASLALERIAVNVLDFEQPDNVGVMRKNDQIVRGGPDARLSNFPFERILDAWHENGVPGYVSNSAGTFLCNQLLYESVALTEGSPSPILAGFVHMPYLPAQAIAAGAQANPSMSFELMKRGIELLIETLVPWVEHRTPEASRERSKGRVMWIPRGVKEVER
ncbi:MAG: pyroglutamyl-peptidase I [Vulcanimicrobiaceae bacterium]